LSTNLISAPLAYPPGKGLTEYVLRKGMPVSVNPEEFDELVSLKEVSLVGAPRWIGLGFRYAWKKKSSV